MKKFVPFSILLLGLMVFVGASVTPAQATCIHFGDFCDQVSVKSDAYGNIYGFWDWQCDGGASASMVYGRRTPHMLFVSRPNFSDGSVWYYTGLYLFNNNNSTFSNYFTDGNVSFAYLSGYPYSTSAGSCTFAGVKGTSTAGKQVNRRK